MKGSAQSLAANPVFLRRAGHKQVQRPPEKSKREANMEARKGILRPFYQGLKLLDAGFRMAGRVKKRLIQCAPHVYCALIAFSPDIRLWFFDCGDLWPQQICSGPLHLVFIFSP